MRADLRLDVADLTVYLAGSIGQTSLDRLGDRAHPELDQHLAAVTEAVTDALGGYASDPHQMLGGLVRYACGFLDAATVGGWRPTADDDTSLDWESMRLATICHLVSSLDAAD